MAKVANLGKVAKLGNHLFGFTNLYILICKKNCMLISVIIPAYNTEKYIGKCLHSVVNQSYKEIEIIVINDASTDSTLDIINQYRAKDNRIRLINQPVNKGNGMGRNMALKMAKGEYVMFVDSDDKITPDAVKLLVEKVESAHKPDVVYMAYKAVIYKKDGSVRREGTTLPRITCNETPELLFRYFLLNRSLRVPVWEYFVRREYLLANDIFFDDSGIHFEDIIFSAKLFYHISSIAKLEVPVYHYNLRLGSIVRSWTAKTINDRLTAILSVKDMLKAHNDFERFRDCYTYFFVNSALVSSFIDYAQMGKHNAEIEDYFKELSKQPFIRQFPSIKLDLPQTFTNKRERKAYDGLKRTTYSISHHFGWTLFWLRSWIKLSNLFHPYSEVA